MSAPQQASGPNEQKLDPAELRLRSSPAAVTRISRKALAVLAGVGGVAVGAAVLYALDPPQLFRRGAAPELYNTDAKPGADGLAALPRDYASIPKPAVPQPIVPQLGPPLPGDLGRPILRAQAGRPTQVGIPQPEADPDASKRLQEADQALRSRVFFQLANRQRAGAPAPHREASSRSGETADTENLAIGSDPELRQNMQDRKLAFLKAPAERQIYASHATQRPASDYQLMAGTVISAALVTAVESDLPGLVKAQITEPVYDTVTGRHCLVPQGSTLVGTYDSQVAFGQRRVQLVWTRMLRPDGTSIVLDRLQATDAIGKAGLEDEVDHHWGRLFVAAAVSTLLGVGAELGASDADRLIDALRRGGQDTFNRAGQDIVRRNLNIQPTLTLRPGLPLRVIVHRDIILPPVRRTSEGTCQA
jgi:type IV secretion system protein TrbI